MKIGTVRETRIGGGVVAAVTRVVAIATHVLRDVRWWIAWWSVVVGGAMEPTEVEQTRDDGEVGGSVTMNVAMR